MGRRMRVTRVRLGLHEHYRGMADRCFQCSISGFKYMLIFSSHLGSDAKVNMWFKNMGSMSMKSVGSTGVRGAGDVKKPAAAAARSSLARGVERISLRDRLVFGLMSLIIWMDRNLPIISPKTRGKIM